MNHLDTIGLDELRAERRRLSAECARLLWSRRLITARRDLEVARLTGAATGLWEPGDAEQHLLDHRVCHPGTDLLSQLSQSVRTLTIAAQSAQRDLDSATSELVRRYQQQPQLCLPGGTLTDAAG